MSFRYTWQDEASTLGSTPTVPQAKQQQQLEQEEPKEGYTSAVSFDIEMQIVTSYVTNTVQPSLSSTPASTTPGPGDAGAPGGGQPYPDPELGSSVPGPGPMNATTAMLRMNGTDMNPPPVLWAQFVYAAVKMTWSTVSQVVSWVSRYKDWKARNEQPDDRIKLRLMHPGTLIVPPLVPLSRGT